MAVTAFIGKKEVALGPPDTLPQLDNDQLAAGDAMARDGHKLLFSDPGAGKTLTALHAMVQVEEMLEEVEDAPDIAAVVLCPNIAVMTWVRWIYAAYDYAGRDAVIQVVKTGADQIRADATHVILTYGLTSQKVRPPVIEELRACDFAIFIADESDNLTGTTSNRAVTVFGSGFAKGKDALCYAADWCWMLTGTAIPAYNDGLFPVLRALFPHVLNRKHLTSKGVEYQPIKTLQDYLFVFCQTRLVKAGKMRDPKVQVCGSRNNELLSHLLYGGKPPICIRIRLKAPEPTFREITLKPLFSEEFVKLEQEIEAAPREDEHGVALLDTRLATAQKMMAVECAPYVLKHVLAETKADRNRGVTLGKVVLYVHTDAGTAIFNGLVRAGLRARMINGSTDAAEDAETERRFNAGECDFVVGQIVAMGVAINLQGNCDHVIFAEETSSDAKNTQAYKRVARRGQTRQVRVDFCRPLSFLADMKVTSADKKAQGAGRVLDG